ncbi:TlpA disulfide reductase family protein [Hydrogenophaga sp. A37]|uniref:TlpA disulfide reductase family protein n=1 Tax=Hydrogenophaga sp. A37 TaxID=1945864 RepID=UPI000985CF70|nr:TlpA disulfide reductase family protein [Hydrogenophaga sp. A37]
MMQRRLWMGGVAAVAMAAGAGAAWWRLRPGELLSGAEAAFWATELPGVRGETVALQRFLGRPLLVNFWATWCPPCVEELPLVNAFYRANEPAGWQVLGLAVDQAAPVRSFLQRLPLDFPVALAGLAGTELGRSLGNASGGLPFTVVFGADGTVMHRKLGKLSESDLSLWAGLV